MTLDQTQFRPASAHPAHGTVADTMDTAGPQVWEDMTVEVALSVMTAARTGHLAVCDEDGLRTGLVTRAGLTAVRDGSGYTDRIRLRDIAEVIGPFAPPLTAGADAERATRCRRLGAAPAADEHGTALSALALSR
ncbi:CBS domain-containing protein [Streptomyces heilongjiangensis]|uniref:CBS domain-containing protein n=1 Tax=Streptomyces heilongjiangensis TaxID=945052 RepID=A0ABW1BES9_9ACTN|nr:CBS domain-containing protein [Streptomyces heilongjiangensis]MDC2952420.1 CBS domain-containing protein [Streptomyces heilongjiangensis]